MAEGSIEILLVEDNPDDTKLLLRKLGKSTNGQLKVTTVKNLHDALEYLALNTPDIVLSDLGLPDSHGLDTVTKLMCEAPNIPLVVLSGFDDEAIAIKAVQSGAQDYLVKGQLEGWQIERSLFYAIERARLQTELEQHTQEISGIQSNLLKILNKNADAIIVADKDRKILFTNPAAESLFGQQKKGLIHRLFGFPLNGGKTSEITINRRSKEKTIAEMSVVEINWEGQPAYLASLHNITKRKKMEEALRVSEDKFFKAFRHSPEVVVISNLENGTILEANDTFLRLNGYTREEVVGKESLELGLWVFPEDRAEIMGILKKKGIVSNRECQMRLKSGEIRVWLFSAEIININNIKCMLSVTTDITERKKVEEKLRFSDTALNSIHEGVFALDNEFKITRWNEMCEQMFGINTSEAIGKIVGDIITMAEEYPGQNEKRLKVLLDKGFNREEQIYRTPRGDIWVDVQAQAIEENGERYGWVTLVSDISERKKTEEELRFSHAAFRSIHESVIAMDTKYIITHWNEISEKIYGIKADEAIGKKLTEIIEIEEKLPGENDRRFERLECDGYYREEQLHRTKHGEVWVDISMQAIEENGKRYGWVMLASAITQRKLAETALKQSEEKYRELISTSTDAIISTDSQMRVIIWNQGAEKIFGYTEKEMLGQNILKIILEKDNKAVIKGLTQLNKGDSSKVINKIFEISGLRKNGTDVPIELSASSRKSDETYITTAIIRDIRERKEAEEKLRESEERYRDLFENASDLIQSCTIEGKCIYVNKAWRDALGYSEKEVLNINFWDIIHPDYIVHSTQALQRVISGENVNNVETAFVAKNGRLIQVEGNVNPVRKEGKVVAIRAIFRDITERKEANKKLRESEERYRDLFENANDLIQSVSLDGHFIYVNKAWRDALGYTDKELEKLKLWDIIQPDSLQHCEKVFRKVIQGQTEFVETAFVAKNGKVIFVEGNANLYSRENKVMATRGIFRDTTERKLAEEKLRKIDQMKTEFLSNISHELRTPLQSISGFTKLLMNGQVPDRATQQEFFQIIDRETQHLGNLINGLLDMSRLESGRFQVNKRLIPIRETVIDSIKTFYSIVQEKNITLNEEIPSDLPEMEADGERIRQVIMNLLSNAIKYNDPGGTVTIKAEKHPEELIFQVADGGIGMSPETMKHLFERFYRAEDKQGRSGTGLGLYITKQIVEAHGGHIWVESHLNKGSTFSFNLPFNGKGGNGYGKKNTSYRRRSSDIKTG
jgi:PAS domain S-box-containing protein